MSYIIAAKIGAGIHFFAHQYTKYKLNKTSDEIKEYSTHESSINEYVIENKSYDIVFQLHYDMFRKDKDKNHHKYILNPENNHLFIHTNGIHKEYFNILSKIKQGYRDLHHPRSLFQLDWLGLNKTQIKEYSHSLEKIKDLCLSHGFPHGTFSLSFAASGREINIDNYKKYVRGFLLSEKEYMLSKKHSLDPDSLPKEFMNLLDPNKTQEIEYLDLINKKNDIEWLSNDAFQEYHLKNELLLEKYSILLDADLTQYIP